MRSPTCTIFPAFIFLCIISQQFVTAHETRKPFHSTGCSYITQYCNSCIAEELGANQHISLIVVNCSAKNLTEFPTDLPVTTGKLVLSHNTISRLNLQDMKKMRYLKELFIEENNISFISEGSFQNNFMLESLKMGGNKLPDLTPGIFQGLNNLIKLCFNRNRISRLKNGTFQHLVSLNELDLSANEIFTIEQEVFDGIKHLTYLDLSKNKLRKVSQAIFRNLASLRTLNLGFNQIDSVDKESFFNLMYLKTLCINHNNLTIVPKALTFLRALVNLELSANLIEFIPMEAFSHLRSLEFLNLSSSKVRVFHGKHLKKTLPQLRLSVDHNPLDCTCDLRWLKQWFGDDMRISQNSKVYNLSRVKCGYPKPLSGKSLMSLNITDMKCSCEYCQKSSMCVSGRKTCNCANSWAGTLCSDTCQSHVTNTIVRPYELMCSSSQGKCFCSNMSEICVNNAYLAYANGSSPDCVCKPGYHGNGFLNCTDVDECARVHNLCHKSADCINTDGSFRCTCQNGYQGDGVSCHSIKHHNVFAIATASVSVVMFIALISTLIFCFVPKSRQRAKEGSRSSRSGGKRKKKQSTRRYVDLYKIRELCFTNSVFRQELESSARVDDWEIPREKLRLIRAIGEGAFGVVMEGELDTDEGTTRVAVKTLKADADRHDYKDLMTELAIMKQAGSHPNIVSLLGACSMDGPLYLVMEFVSGGNLLAFLRSNRCQNPHYINMASTLNERELLKIAEDVANGMNYLHGLNLVHRDLAARNVLLTEEKVAKVTDFGLARDVHSEGIYTKTTTAGRLPVKWMAPESIRFHIYTSKSDVWSFGVLLWEIITIGECPYPGIPARLLGGKLMIGYRMNKPIQCSDELYEVMKACWQLDTEARPTFAELANILHGFLARTGRGYINLGDTYNSDLDRVQITAADIHEFRDAERSLTMAIEPDVEHEDEFTPPNEDNLEQCFTTKM